MNVLRFCGGGLTVFAILWSAIVYGRLNPRIEDGLAITHPRIVETLSQRASGTGIGLGYYMDPTGKSTPNLSNMHLSRLPMMQPILNSIRNELTIYSKQYAKKDDTVGVGVNFHQRQFDIRFLEHDGSTFALVGVVNRMDQAYKDPSTCGETRLIYRLAYSVQVNGDKDKIVVSRLPMTINLILNAKSSQSSLTCAEIAQRWRDLNVEGVMIREAADRIFADNGPLAPELRDRSLLKRVEINLQLVRKAAATRPDFGGHAVYLLKVFNWNASNQRFEDSVLDNQVDRLKAKEFYAWLFDAKFKQERLRALDEGTIVIPDRYLMTRAYSIAPGGLSRAINHPLSGTVSDQDIQRQLADTQLSSMMNIKSIEGFKRRLTDISCTGCHQTRAIGGFHFIGQDPMRWIEGKDSFKALYQGNAVVVPGSGHFFADLDRRRVIQHKFTSGMNPEFSSGFSSRPQEHVTNAEGQGAFNGWGAHCYNGNDPSFARWTCAQGTRCTSLHSSQSAKGMGVCTSATGQEIGDPTESGVVTLLGTNWFSDRYTLKQNFSIPTGSDYVNSPQSAQKGSKTGGFPGGAIRLSTCDNSVMNRHPEAQCGSLPAATNGFNDCLFDKSMSFKQCLDKYSKGVGLRGCSRENPCRDDYICAEGFYEGAEDAGVCVPPYFTFQFRVDGHPVKF